MTSPQVENWDGPSLRPFPDFLSTADSMVSSCAIGTTELHRLPQLHRLPRRSVEGLAGLLERSGFEVVLDRRSLAVTRSVAATGLASGLFAGRRAAYLGTEHPS